MAKNKKKSTEHGYSLPAAGAVGLGVPALALQRLDSSLSEAGIPRSRRITEEAISALQRFTRLHPSSMMDPADYLPEYASRARAASSASPFGSGAPKSLAELMNNSPEVRAPARLSENSLLLKLLGARGRSIRDKIKGAVKPSGDAFAEGDRVGKAMASHLLGTSGDFHDAYLRLMDETAGEASPLGVHSNLKAIRKNNKAIAEDLYEAIVNHTRPSRAEFSGKTFSDASEYLDAIWKNNRRDGWLHGIPGAYRDATEIASGAISDASGKDKAVGKLIGLLGGKRSMYGSLRNRLGTSAKFELAKDEAGHNMLRKAKDSVVKNDAVRSKLDAMSFGKKDLATALFHGDAARMFAESPKRHLPDYIAARAYNVVNRLRNPALRAVLGLGSLGSAGILARNVYERNRKKSLSEKLKGAFGIG